MTNDPATADASTPSSGAGAPPSQRAPHHGHAAVRWSIVLLVVGAVALYIGLPELAGLKGTWGRLSSGDPYWLVAAGLLEAGSYAAYVFTFKRLFGGAGSRIGWHESYDISMAGVAATRVFATAGAGGIALTMWAVRRSGMTPREIGSRMTTFYVALYSIFMGALVLFGAGLWTGLLPGPRPLGVTLVPACFGALVIAAALLAARLPADLGERAGKRLRGHPRAARWAAKAAGWAAIVAGGVRGAVGLLRRRDPALLGALGVWLLDMGALWGSFHAFGHVPPPAVVVMAYFTGQMGNVLPLPGGLGGVEGGTIGALLAFGVKGSLAVTVVLCYRVFDYWLTIPPGVVAYFRLLGTVRAWERSA